jgi:Tol biopolymer transport system component
MHIGTKVGPYDLVSLEQATTGIRFLAAGGSREEDLSWLDSSLRRDVSRDATTVLFTETGEGVPDDGAVYVRKTDGSAAVQLGSGVAYAFSPDGASVLATTRSGRNLSLMPTGPGAPQRLTGDSIVRAATFLRDGTGVVFIGFGKDGKMYLYVQPLNGDPRVISRGGEVSGLALSPDGTTVATSIDRRACLVTVAGGAPQPLAWGGYYEMPIAWSADGKSLFMVEMDAGQDIDRVDIATGARTLWKKLVPADGAGVTNVMAVRILDDGRAYAYSYERTLSQLLLVSGLH